MTVSVPGDVPGSFTGNSFQLQDDEAGKFTVFTVAYRDAKLLPNAVQTFSDRQRREFVERIARKGKIEVVLSANEVGAAGIQVVTAKGITNDDRRAEMKVFFFDDEAVVLAHSSAPSKLRATVARAFFSSVTFRSSQRYFTSATPSADLR